MNPAIRDGVRRLDWLSPEARSANTRAGRRWFSGGRDTKPELAVRRMLHAMGEEGGCRYRVQARGLPGRPDLAFTRRRTAVFLHGCFWHGHDCARGARARHEQGFLAGQDRA